MERANQPYDPDEALGLLSKREDIIRRLADGSCHVRDLQGELTVSRSTAYKGVRELETAGVVERTNRGYELSAFGRALLSEYDEFWSRTRSLCEAGPLLSYVPTTAAIPTDVLVGATLTYPTRHAPNRPVHAFERVVEEATTLRGFSPVVLPEYVAVFHDRLVSGALTADLIFERPVIEHLIVDYPGRFEAALGTGQLTVRETTETLPYGLVLADEPQPRVVIVVYDAGGELRGTMTTDSTAAIEWGREVYRTYDEASERIETEGGHDNPADG